MEAVATAPSGRALVRDLRSQRAKGLLAGPAEPRDIPVAQPQGSTDRIADTDPRDCPGASAPRISVDPGAAGPVSPFTNVEEDESAAHRLCKERESLVSLPRARCYSFESK